MISEHVIHKIEAHQGMWSVCWNKIQLFHIFILQMATACRDVFDAGNLRFNYTLVKGSIEEAEYKIID